MIYYETKDMQYSFAHNTKNIKDKKVRHDLHNHNTCEFLYLLDGSVEFNIEGEYYEVNKGDIIMLDCNEFHSLKINNDNVYNRMVIEFSKSFLLGFSQNIDLFYFFKVKKMGINNLLPKRIVDMYKLNKYFMRLRALEPSDAESELRIKCILTELLLDINNIFSKYATISSPKKSNSNIQKVITYISQNLDKDMSLETISNDLFISKYYLWHLFKLETGISIYKYLTIKRIHYANELLNSGMPAAEACFKAGFNDYSTFYRAYKKVLLKAPTVKP